MIGDRTMLVALLGSLRAPPPIIVAVLTVPPDANVLTMTAIPTTATKPINTNFVHFGNLLLFSFFDLITLDFNFLLVAIYFSLLLYIGTLYTTYVRTQAFLRFYIFIFLLLVWPKAVRAL